MVGQRQGKLPYVRQPNSNSNLDEVCLWKGGVVKFPTTFKLIQKSTLTWFINSTLTQYWVK